ncbi:MAG: zf-HC2 domain-containing protein [Acidobacteriaceae bacterium]|nr:zf-HC2 domain-containing protein [Acidobacteriaceae bacterium]
MNCSEFETLLADYVDGALSSGARAALEQHASACADCAAFMTDVTGAVSFLAGAAEIAPPPELITRIAYQAPMGRLRDPLDRPGFLNRIARKWLQPMLQPRLAMGMAMTILSFAMLEKCTGIQVQHIQPADLNPVRVWDGVEDRAMRTKDRAVKYYENIRLVYEIQSRLKEMEAQQEASSQPKPQSKPSGGQSGQRNSQTKSTR